RYVCSRVGEDADKVDARSAEVDGAASRHAAGGQSARGEGSVREGERLLYVAHASACATNSIRASSASRIAARAAPAPLPDSRSEIRAPPPGATATRHRFSAPGTEARRCTEIGVACRNPADRCKGRTRADCAARAATFHR